MSRNEFGNINNTIQNIFMKASDKKDNNNSLSNTKIKSNLKLFQNLFSESIAKNKNMLNSGDYDNPIDLNKIFSTKQVVKKSLIINDLEYHKNFFMLTYQASKINSDEPEIYSIVNKFYLI